MSGKRALILAITTALGVLGTASAAWSFFGDHHRSGGNVMPCSLDGVNPVYHPEIFGNPVIADKGYGFVRSPDRTWHVRSNCIRGINTY
jgi:hypothetical protein